jgi:hypothetical protein
VLSDYQKRHRRVNRTRGPAVLQQCVGECGRRGYGWSHIHDTDPDDVNNYQPMCQRCHMAYDKVGEKVSKALKGRPVTPQQLKNLNGKNAWGWADGRNH